MKVKDFKVTRSIGEYEKVEYTIEDITSVEQAEEYVANLKQNPVKKPARKVEGISDAQLKYLHKLVIEKNLTQGEIAGFLEKFKVKAFNYLTKRDASSAIEELMRLQ